MSGKGFSGDKAKRNGFYIALAVCLVAVGIAAWSTYDAVDGYVSTDEAARRTEASVVSPGRNEASLEQSQTAPSSELSIPDESSAVEKAEDNDDGESLDKYAEKGRAYAESMVEETEEAAAGIEENREELEYGVPVNAGTLYQLSEIMGYPVESTQAVLAYSSGAPVYSKTMKDWRLHNGTDFPAAANEELRACANGQVREVLQDDMLGNVVVIEHGDYMFKYCGLGEEIAVAAGDIVDMGQIIGTVSSTPFEAAEESHMHLEVMRDDVYLNPEEVIKSFQG